MPRNWGNRKNKKNKYENGKECNIANGKRKMALVKKNERAKIKEKWGKLEYKLWKFLWKIYYILVLLIYLPIKLLFDESGFEGS